MQPIRQSSASHRVLLRTVGTPNIASVTWSGRGHRSRRATREEFGGRGRLDRSTPHRIDVPVTETATDVPFCPSVSIIVNPEHLLPGICRRPRTSRDSLNSRVVGRQVLADPQIAAVAPREDGGALGHVQFQPALMPVLRGCPVLGSIAASISCTRVTTFPRLSSKNASMRARIEGRRYGPWIVALSSAFGVPVSRDPCPRDR